MISAPSTYRSTNTDSVGPADAPPAGAVPSAADGRSTPSSADTVTRSGAPVLTLADAAHTLAPAPHTATPAAGQVGANQAVEVATKSGESAASLHARALQEMALQAGLSPAATAEFVRRASTLDNGKLHVPSQAAGVDGAELSDADLARASADGKVRVAPTVAQAGLLHLLQANDGADIPSGAAAGFVLPPSGPAWKPANTAVTPEIAAEILRNIANNQPPFKPELGNVGGVTWLVSGGEPYTGTGDAKSVALPVEVANTSGKPVTTFAEKQLLEIYERQRPAALATAEQQYRQRTGLNLEEPLSKGAQKSIARDASRMAERQMWTEVGDTVRNSPSGIGKVELKDSVFSKGGDGEFILTSKAQNIRIAGGSKTLVDIIETHGVKAEPGVLDAAKELAAKEGWGGTVRGAFRVGGRVLIVVGAGVDAYKIYTAQDKLKAATEVAGGWGGAFAAAGAFDVATAPVDFAGPLGWAAQGIGSLVAGGIGYYAGSHAAKALYELAVEGKPLVVPAGK